MDLFLDDEVEETVDPMDTVEAVIASDDRFMAERAEDGDVHFTFKAAWGETAGYFSHRRELPALLFTLGFEQQAPKSRLIEAQAMLAAALDAADRFQPAFQFLILAGMPAEQAAEAALFETAGEA